MDEKIEKISLITKQIASINYKRLYLLLDTIDLYPGQHILLDIILKNEGISQSKLAKLSYKEPATITTMLIKMENQKLIERFSDVHDKRVIRVFLTQKGKNICNHLENLVFDYEKSLFVNLSVEEINMFLNILLKIKDNLENN